MKWYYLTDDIVSQYICTIIFVETFSLTIAFNTGKVLTHFSHESNW